MSLISSQPYPFIAEDDIICHKFMKKGANGVFRSPYKKMSWEIGKVYTVDLDIVPVNIFKAQSVIHGGLHAFLYPIQPIANALSRPEQYVAVTCIIPQGAEYFTDSGECELHAQIVSNQMIMAGVRMP